MKMRATVLLTLLASTLLAPGVKADSAHPVNFGVLLTTRGTGLQNWSFTDTAQIPIGDSKWSCVTTRPEVRSFEGRMYSRSTLTCSKGDDAVSVATSCDITDEFVVDRNDFDLIEKGVRRSLTLFCNNRVDPQKH